VTKVTGLGGVEQASTELLEREDEFSALDGCLEMVRRSSHGRVVFVTGEAGIGKTALLRRFCEEHVRPGRILWGACDPLFTPRPLGPLVSVADETGGELAEVMDNGRLPHEMATALSHELRANPPTVFVLEDIHWADEATLDVLRLLARRVDTVPGLVLVSYRDDELARDHPLRIVLGELVRSEAVQRLKLRALSLRAVAQLAEPAGVDPRELYRKTGGNPFFVLEALAAGGNDIPDNVRDAVFARAARLGDRARRLLEAVAVVPPQAEFWLLKALAPNELDALDDCLTSGMLTSGPAGIAFRHELARLAVEDVMPRDRRVDLHRNALTALADPPQGPPDLARLAHHAEAAGDVEAVLRFAPAAAASAASLGAHRESAAQYTRALRFGGRLSPATRAELLEAQARECYLTDQYDDGIAALEQAHATRQTLDDVLKAGDDQRRLSEFLWCPGRTAEAERYARSAVTTLEQRPPGRELAWAYANLAFICLTASVWEEAIVCGQRAVELAERLDETEIACHAQATVACVLGYRELEHALQRALAAGLNDIAGHIFVLLGIVAVENRQHEIASRHLEAGIAFCRERGLELSLLYLLAYRARLELDAGRWADAVISAEAVLRVPRSSNKPRIVSLVVLGLVRARRGDPEVSPLLDEAWALAEPTAEIMRLGPVASARAEAAWLHGDHDTVDRATAAALALAVERPSPWLAAELAVWRRRAGLALDGLTDAVQAIAQVAGPIEQDPVGPLALQLAGKPTQAAEHWRKLDCPYDAALALADAGDEKSLRQALEELQQLDARAAATGITHRLRELGARGLPRGPRPTTRHNPAGLTQREQEVLGLLAEGLHNAEIAQRLTLSSRTVAHHVQAILRKLGARTRAEASATAVRLHLLP